MMKPSKFLCIVLCANLLFPVGCATTPRSGNAISLDRAIQIATENIEQKIGNTSPSNAASAANSAEKDMATGNTGFDTARQRAQASSQKPIIAVLNINSSSDDLSRYILDELSLALAGRSGFIVVDRQELDTIRREENFQLSGEVSDATALSVGQKLGAQYVVTGELQEMGNYFRFRIKALDVATASINAPTSLNVSRNDSQMQYFLSAVKTEQQRKTAQEKEAEKQRVAQERYWAAEDRRDAAEQRAEDRRDAAKARKKEAAKFFGKNWIWMVSLGLMGGVTAGGIQVMRQADSKDENESGGWLIVLGNLTALPGLILGILVASEVIE